MREGLLFTLELCGPEQFHGCRGLGLVLALASLLWVEGESDLTASTGHVLGKHVYKQSTSAAEIRGILLELFSGDCKQRVGI